MERREACGCSRLLFCQVEIRADQRTSSFRKISTFFHQSYSFLILMHYLSINHSPVHLRVLHTRKISVNVLLYLQAESSLKNNKRGSLALLETLWPALKITQNAKKKKKVS